MWCYLHRLRTYDLDLQLVDVATLIEDLVPYHAMICKAFCNLGMPTDNYGLVARPRAQWNRNTSRISFTMDAGQCHSRLLGHRPQMRTRPHIVQARNHLLDDHLHVPELAFLSGLNTSAHSQPYPLRPKAQCQRFGGTLCQAVYRL